MLSEGCMNSDQPRLWSAPWSARCRIVLGACVVGASLVLSACGGDLPTAGVDVVVKPGEENPPPPPPFIASYRVGAASENIDPTPSQLAGVMVGIPFITEKLQQFNLGGYGSVQPPMSPSELVNFDIGGPPASGLGDGTFVRAMAIEPIDAPEQRILLVMIDATGAGNVIQDRVKAAIRDATNIPADRILFAQTHSHAAADLQGLWGGVPSGWIDCADLSPERACNAEEKKGLIQLAASAAKKAVDGMQPAHLELTQTELRGEARLNNYRRCNPQEVLEPDSFLTMVRAVGMDGKSVATLLNYTAHPTVLGLENRQVHTDWVGSALRDLEKIHGGTALFFNGPIADASPRSPGSGDMYARAEAMGKAVAAAATGAIAGNTTRLGPGLEFRSAQAFLPVMNPLFTAAAGLRLLNGYYSFSPIPSEVLAQIPGVNELPQVALYASTPVNRLVFGAAEDPTVGFEIVTIPGEASMRVAQDLRQRSPRKMALLGLTQNSFGYILTEDEYGSGLMECQADGFYEETVSLGPLTAPLLRLQAYDRLFGN